jgi:NifU-like protein involved in Fe-S cluster formation
VREEEVHLRDALEMHAQNPYGQGSLGTPTYSGYWVSPKTGNHCRVELALDKKVIRRLVAKVEGSALAKACASIMCSGLEGENLEHAHFMLKTVETWIEQGIAPKEWVGDIAVYQSLRQYPERLDCSMLCWRSLATALSD